MSVAIEIDSILKDALKLLHSPNPDSAEKIRLSLDEIIKQRHGSSKTITNNISKKYLAEEGNFPSIKRHKSSDSRSSMGRNVSPMPQELSGQSEPVTINLTDIKTIDVSEEENLKEFGDLTCVVCHAMVFTAGNRLIECAECHSLYHQECHEPHITDDDANEQEFSWCCASCKNKVIMSKAATIASVPSPSKSSSSSSSSSSSNSNHKSYDITSKSKSNSSKSSSSSKSHFGSSSSSSFSTTIQTGGTSSSTKHSSSTVTPNINIISADKRLQIMKKKAAKQQESKRKHK